MKKTDLAVVIIAKNEADMIEKCMKSCKLLTPMEIIVIDDDSDDATAQIAERLGAKVYLHKKKDFAEAREFGLHQTHAAWILYVDADEMISPELITEIIGIIEHSKPFAAYRVPRINYYLDERWPGFELVTRLFRKGGLIGWFGKLHESPRVEGDIGMLTGAIIHHTHRNLVEMVENTLVWSQIEAKNRFDAGHPPVYWWRLPRVMLPVFFDYYVKQGGWRVGSVGLIESLYQAFSIFITFARLWELQKKYQISNIKYQK